MPPEGVRVDATPSPGLEVRGLPQKISSRFRWWAWLLISQPILNSTPQERGHLARSLCGRDARTPG
jgi:hypothetical protein